MKPLCTIGKTNGNKKQESELAEYKQQAKLIFRRLNENSEPQASIESGPYTLQLVQTPCVYVCAEGVVTKKYSSK